MSEPRTAARSASPEYIVFGPCPVCGNWQVEVPADTTGEVIEEVIIEHDAEDHPGELAAMAEQQREWTQRLVDTVQGLGTPGG